MTTLCEYEDREYDYYLDEIEIEFFSQLEHCMDIDSYDDYFIDFE